MADRDSTPKTRKNAVLPIPCRACGKEFKPRKKTTKFCCRACQFEGQRTAGQWADCEHCGSRFYARAWQGADRKSLQRYCTKACAHDALRLESAPPRQLVHFVACKCCNRTFAAPRSDAAYCGAECRRESARQAARAHGERAHKASSHKCKECRKVFAPEYGDKRRAFCSGLCAGRHQRRIRRSAERARMRAARVESVNPLKVFERDGWKCMLCGRRTLKSKRGTTHPRAPELDHIVTLAEGGEHSYRNTQCACRECNHAKSSASRGQLHLLGC